MIKKLFAALESLKNKPYRIVGCNEHSNKTEEIRKFEEKYGFHLPEDFKEFLQSEYGAMILEVCDEEWEEPYNGQVAEADFFRRGLMVYGFGKDLSPDVDLWSRTDDMWEMGYEEFVPFMVHIGDEEEVYCFDEEGNIVLFDYYQSYSEIDIDMSFTELLIKELQELEENRKKYAQQD